MGTLRLVVDAVMRSLYYRKDGSPYEGPNATLEWAKDFENREYQGVARDDFDGGYVSTVWLGLDHRYSESGPPLIFETMVFGGPLDGEQDRYSTESEAIKGHKEMVERCKKVNHDPHS